MLVTDSEFGGASVLYSSDPNLFAHEKVFVQTSNWTCLLAGPWHDSQPMPLALAPSVIILAWVAPSKLCDTSEWHWAHSLEPTNSAPATFSGGAIMVRSTMTHDTRRSPQGETPPKSRVDFDQRSLGLIDNLSG